MAELGDPLHQRDVLYPTSRTCKAKSSRLIKDYLCDDLAVADFKGKGISHYSNASYL